MGDVLPLKLQRYIYFIEGPNEEKRGVTVLDSHYCATYSHGSHVQYKEGDFIMVTNYATNTAYPTTVMKVEDPKGSDYIILKISSAKDRFPVCNSDYNMSLPVKGSAYVMPAFSAKHNGNGLRLTVGSIQTERVDSRMHFLGSSGSNPGDSGCPVVARPHSADDKYLVFGMNVGSSSKGAQNPVQAHIVAAFHLWNAIETLEAAKHVGESEDFEE
uniref:Peptidase S1 domain-containing protein n=1 Tax=Ditylenchus dipsaci TaxID=166011 RepID=A0A915ER63_9BILA